MAINFKLGNEQGGTIEHGDIVESDELPDFEDERYPYLRLIDPYGATMFSYYQMAGVLPELERWAAEHPSPTSIASWSWRAVATPLTSFSGSSGTRGHTPGSRTVRDAGTNRPLAAFSG